MPQCQAVQAKCEECADRNKRAFEIFVVEMNKKFISMLKDVIALMDNVTIRMGLLENEVSLHGKAPSIPREMVTISKIKVLEPKSFNGTRNAK